MKNFILNNSSWVKRYLTRRYPLSIYVVARHAGFIDWQLLSENCEIEYTEEFCVKFEDRINWEVFNPLRSKYFLGEGRDARLISFLDRFKNKVDWVDVSLWFDNPENIEAVLQRYDNYWHWELISRNEDIQWTLPLLRRFREKLDWNSISASLTIEWKYEWLIEFESLINWQYFYSNAHWEWSLSSILRFKDSLQKAEIEPDLTEYLLNKERSDSDLWNMRPDKDYTENEDDIKYPGYWNRIEKIKEIIIENRNILDRINFEEYILWSNEAFDYVMNCNGTDITHLSTYSRFKDPVAILRKYGDRLDWGSIWSDLLPEEVAHHAYVLIPSGISANKQILWTEEMIDEFRDQIHWDIFSKEARVVWTASIIEKYFPYMDKNALLGENVVVGDNRLFLDLIVPHLNDRLIEVVMGYSEN